MSKFGLGKGLEALIPESAPEENGAGILSVPVSRLVPNADQPRKRFDDESIAELAESIKRHGVIQPLVVENDGSGGYRIIAGERRWRAATLAGLAEVPVIVKEYGREKRLEVALVENVQREDLNPIDEAEAYRQLMEATGLTQDQVAERVGKSRPAVANALRLLGLPADAMESLRSGAISAGHARALLSVLNPADRSAILRRAVDEGISVREAEA
ncbi:MAG: ParB/RepB/Spo0J family partition protein, partial [Spirochaetales bacterium]|nr:ParB/RepB/Spo0J family partition protein [Spirochaetales bacterium]